MEQESILSESANPPNPPDQVNESNIPQEITSQSHALGILLNAIEVAQRRGAFNLDEAELLSRARKLFIKANATAENTKALTNEST